MGRRIVDDVVVVEASPAVIARAERAEVAVVESIAGTDSYTGRPRHDGRVWVMNNELSALFDVLEHIYYKGKSPKATDPIVYLEGRPYDDGFA